MYWTLFAVACVVVAFVLLAKPWKPRVSLRHIRGTTPPEFRIRTWSINSIMNVDVWSITHDEMQWTCRVNQKKLTTIAYGTNPPGTIQVYPPTGAPRAIRAGEHIVISITCQYDIPPVTAAVGTMYFLCHVDAQGVVVDLKQVPYVQWPQKHSTQ